jgi:hypothetical protein
MVSLFFEKKDTKPLEYQEKLCSMRMFGVTDNKVEVLLGEKTFDVCLYANRVNHKLEIPLTEGKLPRNALVLILSIVVPSRMADIGVTQEMLSGNKIA